jgi:hypothetical protein
MLPEPIVCLRCAFPRTVRLGRRRVCFQCRYSWFYRTSATVAPVCEVLAEKTAVYPFTAAELVRLHAYRRAVQARFYSDDLEPDA